MNEKEITKLVDVFEKKYPLQIANIIMFRRHARFCKLAVEEFERIIDDYKIYLATTKYVCKTPESFLYEKLYQTDFSIATNNFYATEGKETPNINGDLELQKQYFEVNLKQKFMADYNGYDLFIPEAKHLFDFEPYFEKDAITGKLKVSETQCRVYLPFPHLEKEFFNKMSKMYRLQTLIQLKYSHLGWYEEHLAREKNGDYIANDNSNFEELCEKYGVE